jgi:hypothetical protein
MTQLYLICVRAKGSDLPARLIGAVKLDEGLYLVRTTQTRSQLYHEIKRRLAPAALLVAPLSDLPKFKGMRRGASRDIAAMLDD